MDATAHSNTSLCNQLLVAMPALKDPNFDGTVTLLCEHSAEGALGIIVNRPTALSVGELFAQLDLDEELPGNAATVRAAADSDPVLYGGPVAMDRGFVLHTPELSYESSVSISDHVQLTISKDILDAMSSGDGPRKSVVALGYAGWDAGQLEAEILENAWLTVPATAEIVFDTPFDDRWRAAAGTLGIDINQMPADAGHA